MYGHLNLKLCNRYDSCKVMLCIVFIGVGVCV